MEIIIAIVIGVIILTLSIPLVLIWSEAKKSRESLDKILKYTVVTHNVIQFQEGLEIKIEDDEPVN